SGPLEEGHQQLDDPPAQPRPCFRPASRSYQYLVVAAEPYETIAFKIPSRMVERKEGIALPDNGAAAAIRGSIAPGRVIDEPPTWSHWSPDSKTYTIQVIFR
ncbi:hypothetical protein CF319_g9006, partial [Tilletia indica]